MTSMSLTVVVPNHPNEWTRRPFCIGHLHKFEENMDLEDHLMMLDAQLVLYGLGPGMWLALFPLSLRARQQIWYYSMRETERVTREQIFWDPRLKRLKSKI